MLGTSISWAQNPAVQVRMVVSSSIFVSGDLVKLKLLTLDEEGKPISDGALINLYLVTHNGQTAEIKRFDSSQNDSGSAFLLPSELSTGNYKLVGHIPGSKFQTEAIIHVYSPTIFSSTALPANANPDLGLPSPTPMKEISDLELEVQQAILTVNSKSSESGFLTMKIFDSFLETAPVLGTVKNSEIDVNNSGKFELTPLSNDPNSRISVFFLEQGIVEEFNMRDSLEMESKLIRHRGSSSIWAYQFDNLGQNIGEVFVEVEEWDSNQFSSFENIVPFNDRVVNILDHKRKRKYIDQIYGTDIDNFESIWEETEIVKADQVYFSKDYESIATLREAFSGIVSKASVKRSKDGYQLVLSPANAGFRFENGPLILFNGSPIFELGELIETPFHLIESISVFNSIQSLKRFGILGRFGVVSIEMKEEFDNPLIAKKEAYPYYHGVNELVQVKEEFDPTDPDLRPVLLWGSSQFIQPDQTLTFDWKASDVLANYVMWIDFIRNDGASIQWSQPVPTQFAQ
ncbi:hypothetical protein SYJ56_16750 [Algoriphagus sp. D3-2-R+10]|uniref:hypothetical protein n=1 Tax=Algoriphagus aurantiacus TaxID=3103948 RepID=UPI002B3B1649|nr:hypothetical protein [Algoriphagus sp. D3-2-R+10]MEB2776968.1 hypothetical protein [Algoriphagus sp. D3-2-R+10]